MFSVIFLFFVSLVGHAQVGVISPGSIPAKKQGTLRTASDVGSPLVGVRNDADAALSTGDLQYTPVSLDATGRVKVDATISEAATAAPGAPIPVKSKVVAGEDPFGNVKNLTLDNSGNLKVIANEVATGADGGAAPTLGKMIMGRDGGGLSRYALMSAAGRLQIDVSSIPLPTDAATETTLAALSAKFNSLGQKLMAGSIPVTIASDQGALAVSQSGSWDIRDITGSIPLPTGAATAAKQDTGNTSLGSIDGKLTTTVNGLKVDGSAVTQPVSASALPLPTGAATEATLSALNGKVVAVDTGSIAGTVSAKVQDGAGNAIGSTAGALNVAITSGGGTNPSVSATGAAVPTSATYLGVDVGGNLTALQATASGLKVDGSAVTQPVSAAALPLPTGAATSAKQDTGNTSLASIDGKFGSLGQKAMAGSAPVVLASDQSALATKAPVNINGSQVTGTVSTVITLTAPANAVGFVLQAADTNTANVRYRLGAVATTTVGQQLQPGRDSGYIPAAVDISIVAESGTQEYQVQWILSQ